ncbi:hypothetical protein [Sideroxyarcus sp. TK5]
MNMRHPYFLASLLFALLASGVARAEETPPAYPAMGEMTQEEYAAYRARISKQLEEKEQSGSSEAKETRIRKPANGYGQGYRARQERARDAGMMGRAAGRNR